ncbi:hypothetical protein, partial [Aeromonas jandaei]|uniref:hypothetical protein n=1 Tax=Aeromonas jandaei TaxID=650 RepID=UPI001E44BB1A
YIRHGKLNQKEKTKFLLTCDDAAELFSLICPFSFLDIMLLGCGFQFFLSLILVLAVSKDIQVDLPKISYPIQNLVA